jgi:hypothetical protein
MVAIGGLEVAFIVFVSTMTVLAALFAVYVLVQQFRNPFRR